MGLNIGHTGRYQVDHILDSPPYTLTDSGRGSIVSLVKFATTKAGQPFIGGQSKIIEGSLVVEPWVLPRGK